MAGKNLDVVFYETFPEEEKALRKYINGSIEAHFTTKSLQEENTRSLPSKLISIRTQSIIPIEWHSQLKGVLTRTSGCDHLLQSNWSNSQDVSLGHLPLYCSRSVAEHAMMLCLNLLKKFKKQTKNFLNFDRNGITGLDCFGKKLFILGVGNIGYEIAKIGKSLNMKVFGYDVNRAHEDVEYIDLELGISDADIIICAMSLTESNSGLLNYDILSKAKKAPIFINIARGNISPLDDLQILLDQGILSGLGMDVFQEETELANQLKFSGQIQSEYVKILLILNERDNVIFTPHNAFNSEESVQRKAFHTIEQIDHFLKYGAFKWQIQPKEQVPISNNQLSIPQ